MRAALVPALAAVCLLSSGCAAGGGADASASPSPSALLTQAGRGPTSTAGFQAEAGWDVLFTYDCAEGERPGFLLRVQHDGRPINVIAERSGVTGEGTTRWPHAGSFSLDVATACAWTVEVT